MFPQSKADKVNSFKSSFSLYDDKFTKQITKSYEKKYTVVEAGTVKAPEGWSVNNVLEAMQHAADSLDDPIPRYLQNVLESEAQRVIRESNRYDTRNNLQAEIHSALTRVLNNEIASARMHAFSMQPRPENNQIEIRAIIQNEVDFINVQFNIGEDR